jgi:hypothetical protein
MTHFIRFVKSACGHFLQTTDKLYNFINASRVDNPFLINLDKYLTNFLKHITSLRELIRFVAPIITSSFLLDSYPPDSYYKLITCFE